MSSPEYELPDDVKGMTFHEIEAKYGEEVAINAGIAADPDTWELTAEEMARSRPAIEVVPEIVAAYRRGQRARRMRGKQKEPLKVPVSLRLDPDVVEHFRATGRGWQTRINDTLRRAAFGSHARGS